MNNLVLEAERQFDICNACRYCEGFCAVFPTMEERTSFKEKDVVYIANLCHDCRACLYACPYAPPHEYAVNIPKVLSELRSETYERMSTPRVSQVLFRRPVVLGVVAALVSTALLVLIASLDASLLGFPVSELGAGSIYRVFPYDSIVLGGLLAGGFAVAIYASRLRKFWGEIDEGSSSWSRGSVFGALKQAFGHTWFRGGGPGCDYPSEEKSYSRLVWHVLVFSGFLFAGASTILAAVYQDGLGILPPYSLLSLPVLLGVIGGVQLVAGSSGLLVLKTKSDRAASTGRMRSLDAAFIVLLDLVALTGFAALVFRDSMSMPLVFAVHLGLVLGLFITAPYGKFVHFGYRFLSLVKYSDEERQRNQVKV